MSNPLAMLGLDLDEVLATDDALRVKPKHRDGRICLCGHSVTRHQVEPVTGIFGGCTPSRLQCPCKRINPVFDAEDTRPFMRKTNWSGSEHAFARGLAKLVESGKSGEWIIDLNCFACGQPSDSLIPMCMTDTGREIPHGAEPTGYDALMCPTCVDRIRSATLASVPNGDE